VTVIPADFSLADYPLADYPLMDKRNLREHS